MSRRKHGATVADIVQLLTSIGPMTRAEMCQHLGLDRRSVSAVVTRMSRPSPRFEKRAYVESYVYDMEGERTYPRAVYALGNKPDAKKPKADPKAAKRRYNAKVKARNTANFVFNLALPRRVYENRKPANTMKAAA